MRIDGRQFNEMRPIAITPDWLKTADGSALVEFGDTKVLCTATVESFPAPHRKDTGFGWVTAEYAMLPRSSNQRIARSKNLTSGRTHEIQRLIGRCLRAVFDMEKFGERTIIIDCDVLQADGGTRTAAITGGFVALVLAMRKLMESRQASSLLVLDFVAAASVGVVEGRPALDLCYLEDAQAEVDMNVAMTGSGQLVEVQGTAEGAPFSRERMNELIDLAGEGIQRVIAVQKQVLGIENLPGLGEAKEAR
ncbi:MAG: ribonuclease PH [Candidatus Sumerlaeota bacterium]|nr:ribonuclease PH [Candidatus Sumerlaeota bacterium]